MRSVKTVGRETIFASDAVFGDCRQESDRRTGLACPVLIRTSWLGWRSEHFPSLLRLPIGVSTKQAVGETHLIDDEESEDQADNAARDTQAVIQALEALVRNRERHGDRRGDEHHPGNGANPEDKQVGNRPRGDANGGQDEQSDGRGTSEAVNDAYRERAQRLIQAETAKSAVQP